MGVTGLLLALGAYTGELCPSQVITENTNLVLDLSHIIHVCLVRAFQTVSKGDWSDFRAELTTEVRQWKALGDAGVRLRARFDGKRLGAKIDNELRAQAVAKLPKSVQAHVYSPCGYTYTPAARKALMDHAMDQDAVDKLLKKQVHARSIDAVPYAIQVRCCCCWRRRKGEGEPGLIFEFPPHPSSPVHGGVSLAFRGCD